MARDNPALEVEAPERLCRATAIHPVDRPAVVAVTADGRQGRRIYAPDISTQRHQRSLSDTSKSILYVLVLFHSRDEKG